MVWATGAEVGQVPEECYTHLDWLLLSEICFISFPLGTVQFYASLLLYRNYLHILDRMFAKENLFLLLQSIRVSKKPMRFLSSSAENVALVHR